MKVYLFISNHKKLLKMYLPYIEALNKQLDITNNLVDADIDQRMHGFSTNSGGGRGG